MGKNIQYGHKRTFTSLGKLYRKNRLYLKNKARINFVAVWHSKRYNMTCGYRRFIETEGQIFEN